MTSASKENSQFLAAAEAYAARGWPVFPLQSRDKAPLKGTRGFIDASTDRTKVLEWWQLFPECNVGLATGVAFDVLDIDGPDSVPALRNILGRDYKHTGPVATTGKGKHLYFLAMDGARNRAGLLGGKLDYRGTGGYVVAPPSVHPSGRRYHWDDGRDFRCPLPEVPDALRAVVLKEETRPAPARIAIVNDEEVISISRGGQNALDQRDIIEVAMTIGLNVLPHPEGGVVSCPFHYDPGPSMVLYAHDNSFHCFGCEAHGWSNQLLECRDMTGRKFL